MLKFFFIFTSPIKSEKNFPLCPAGKTCFRTSRQCHSEEPSGGNRNSWRFARLHENASFEWTPIRVPLMCLSNCGNGRGANIMHSARLQLRRCRCRNCWRWGAMTFQPKSIKTLTQRKSWTYHNNSAQFLSRKNPGKRLKNRMSTSTNPPPRIWAPRSETLQSNPQNRRRADNEAKTISAYSNRNARKVGPAMQTTRERAPDNGFWNCQNPFSDEITARVFWRPKCSIPQLLFLVIAFPFPVIAFNLFWPEFDFYKMRSFLESLAPSFYQNVI